MKFVTTIIGKARLIYVDGGDKCGLNFIYQIILEFFFSEKRIMVNHVTMI